MPKTLEQRVVDLENWAAALVNWYGSAGGDSKSKAHVWYKDVAGRLDRVDPPGHKGYVPPPPPPPDYPPKG